MQADYLPVAIASETRELELKNAGSLKRIA